MKDTLKTLSTAGCHRRRRRELVVRPARRGLEGIIGKKPIPSTAEQETRLDQVEMREETGIRHRGIYAFR
jgi:hypothetical protein